MRYEFGLIVVVETMGVNRLLHLQFDTHICPIASMAPFVLEYLHVGRSEGAEIDFVARRRQV